MYFYSIYCSIFHDAKCVHTHTQYKHILVYTDVSVSIWLRVIKTVCLCCFLIVFHFCSSSRQLEQMLKPPLPVSHRGPRVWSGPAEPMVRTWSAGPSVDATDCSWVLITNLVRRALRTSRIQAVLLPPLWMGFRLGWQKHCRFAAAMFVQGLPSRAEGPISQGPLHFVFISQPGSVWSCCFEAKLK